MNSQQKTDLVRYQIVDKEIRYLKGQTWAITTSSILLLKLILYLKSTLSNKIDICIQYILTIPLVIIAAFIFAFFMNRFIKGLEAWRNEKDIIEERLLHPITITSQPVPPDTNPVSVSINMQANHPSYSRYWVETFFCIIYVICMFWTIVLIVCKNNFDITK